MWSDTPQANGAGRVLVFSLYRGVYPFLRSRLYILTRIPENGAVPGVSPFPYCLDTAIWR